VKIRQTIRGLLAGLVLLVALGVGGLALYRYGVRRDVQAELSAIRAAGLPTNTDEIGRWLDPQQRRRDVTDLYTNALSLLVLPTEGACLRALDALQVVPAPLSDENKAAARAALATNSAGLALLKQVQEMPTCRYLKNWQLDYTVSFSKLRLGVQLLALASMLHVEEGQAHEATESLLAGFALTGSPQGTPTTFCCAASRSWAVFQTRALEWCLARTRFEDEQLARLGVALREVEDPDGLRRAMIVERAWLNGLFEGDVAGNAPQPALMRRPRWFTRLVFERDQLASLHQVAGWIRVQAKPTHERLTAAKEALHRDAEVPWFCFITKSHANAAFERTIAMELTSLAQNRAATTALAAERYRRAQGRWPAELADLVPRFLPELPADPFTGKPLRHRAISNSFVVYSVGLNERDDGSEPADGLTLNPARAKDITFTFRGSNK